MASLISTASKYPYPSTLNPKGFVSIRLSGKENYPQWEIQMLCLIESQELVGFIDGTVLPPPPPETTTGDQERAVGVVVVAAANEEYRMWKRSDRLVKGWILGSLGEQVLPSMVTDQLSTARDVWTRLRSTFGQRDSQENKETEIEEEQPAVARQQAVHYPYPFNFNAYDILSIKLNGTNYEPWVTQLVSLLMNQDLLGFIYGLPPSEVVINPNEDYNASVEVLNEDYMLWRRTDLLLKGWILGSLNEDVLDTVKDLRTSRDVLTKIEQSFVPPDQWVLSDKTMILEDEVSENKEKEIEIEEEVSITTQQHAVHYPYPSTFNAYDILSIKLTGTFNYEPWAAQLIALMASQDLLGFLQDRPIPSEIVLNPNQDIGTEEGEVLNADYMLWRRTDLLLKGWILGSLDDDILDTVKNLRTTRDVLAKIEQSFAPPDQWVLSQKPMIVDEEKDSSLPYVESNFQSAINTRIDDYSMYKYLPLYKAAIAGDWETAKKIFEEEKGAQVAIISTFKQTVVHVAVGTKNIHFIEKLVDFLPKEVLMLEMTTGSTALHIAAASGNTQAVKILMNKNPVPRLKRDIKGSLPIINAISNGQRETFLYLLSVGSDEDYDERTVVFMLTLSIRAGFFDIALDLIKRYPHVARIELGEDDSCPLKVLAKKNLCFRSGMRLNFLESFIYSCVPLKNESHFYKLNDDIENPSNGSKTLVRDGMHLIGVCQRLYLILWDAIEFLVPLIKKIRQKKLGHYNSIQLVRRLCESLKSSNSDPNYERISKAIMCAAELGVFEVVEEIVDMFPHSIWSSKEGNLSISHVAIQNRCEKVFKFIDRMNVFEKRALLSIDDNKNCLLHLVGRLAPQHKLDLVSGAALQMQRELQWFQEVEKCFAHPLFKELRNSDGETPEMVFTREHKELVSEGEKWMKDTANSCTIAASLIITMVFASAITVPGGNNGDTGLPIFSDGAAFWLFLISDAISFFTSTTSLLMFLSILTARYAQHDFLHALPKRLILGLLTLFLSITSMIIAFSATIYLVIGKKRGWILIPLGALSGLPITSFVTLQFPLLRDVIASTYGHGVFGKRSIEYP